MFVQVGSINLVLLNYEFNNTRMIRRNLLEIVRARIAEFDSVALLGPCQVGKTTLARALVDELGSGARYLDLESAADRKRLDDPNRKAHHLNSVQGYSNCISAGCLLFSFASASTLLAYCR